MSKSRLRWHKIIVILSQPEKPLTDVNIFDIGDGIIYDSRCLRWNIVR